MCGDEFDAIHDKEIEEAARRLEQLAEKLDPATVEVLSTDDLEVVATASEIGRSERQPVGPREAPARGC